MPEKTEIFNVRLPKEVIEWIDSLVKDHICSSRSEAVRDLIRQYVRGSR